MKKTMTMWLLLIITSSLVSAQIPLISQIETEPVSVNTGVTFKLHSKSLNEDRVIWISLPKGYDENSRKYPVLYLLDGQWSFNSTSQSLDWLSSKDFGLIPQLIIVGIHTGGDNRMRDLTPTKDKQMNMGGGADKLYEFIKDELIPFVDKNYRTYNYRVIGGTSLSGLYVAYSFTKDPMLFSGYLCQSPSMWWDNRAMLKKFGTFLSKNTELNNRIYLTMANEGVSMGVDSLAQLLASYPNNQLKWKYDKHPDEVHETINYKGTWDGMKYLLADWHHPLVDFGTKGHVFSLKQSSSSENSNRKIKTQSKKVLEKHSGLFIDSYQRVLFLENDGQNLQLSISKLSKLALYPETENIYFLKETDIQNNLFLKGVDISFEFADKDSVVLKANKKIECTATRVKNLKFVPLTDEKMNEYEGEYVPLQFGINIHVIKEGRLLKLTETPSSKTSDGKLIAYLYPVGKNKFFTLYRANPLDVVYNDDESKFSFYIGKNVVLEVKKKID